MTPSVSQLQYKGVLDAEAAVGVVLTTAGSGICFGKCIIYENMLII